MAPVMGADRGPGVFILNLFFVSLAVVILVLRVFTRALIVKAFGLDDWLMILAAVSAGNHIARLKRTRQWPRVRVTDIEGPLDLLHSICCHVQHWRPLRDRPAHGRFVPVPEGKGHDGA